MVESVVCYGCEVWLLKREEQRKLLALEMDYLIIIIIIIIIIIMTITIDPSVSQDRFHDFWLSVSHVKKISWNRNRGVDKAAVSASLTACPRLSLQIAN